MTTTEVDAFLQHYGVKGMRWGVRRNSGSRPSGKEIKEARKRHNAKADAIARQVRIGSDTFDKETQRKAAANIRKIASDPKTISDASVGAKLTRGERVATYLVVGPLAPIVNSSAQKNRVKLATNYMETAKNIKVKDFYDLDKATP